jgi:DNA polymerase-3 subunit alpha
MKEITFRGCGCSFAINQDNNIVYNIDIDNINLECPGTWDLISSGNTKGCFQLESRLGQSMSKKLRPTNIEQLGALISIMRPGCLEAIRDGKSVSNHYIDKKNDEEQIDYFHPALEQTLSSTYGEMVYQEQAMEICQKIAGFNLEEADMLRKAIGKKKPEEMAKIKHLFEIKAQQIGILSQSQIEEIFGWIEKSQRYSFNKSHAISYALNAYLSAYTKYHFPHKFFTSYLQFAKDKIEPMEEIRDLVNNAREMNISINGPDFRKFNKDFILIDQEIYFGLTNIKGVGKSVYDKLIQIKKDQSKAIESMSYLEFLFYYLDNINSAAAKAIVSAGCLSYFKYTRNKIIFDLDIISNITKKEKDKIISHIDFNRMKDVREAIASILSNVNKSRRVILESLIKAMAKPAYSLEDTPSWISDTEYNLLGISITCCKIDGCDLEAANADCRSVNNKTYSRKNIIIGAEIIGVNIVKTKTGLNPGQDMCFLRLSDSTGCCDVIVFPEEYGRYKGLLTNNNTIMLNLEPSKKKDGVILKKCWQL